MSGQADIQGPPKGKEMYEAFVSQCRKVYKEDKVQSGIFGSTCEIALINDVSSAPYPAVVWALDRSLDYVGDGVRRTLTSSISHLRTLDRSSQSR